MLDKFRDNTRSIGTYIIFGVLIVVFVAFFGPGSQGCQGLGGGGGMATYAAKVNGEEISLREFETAYGTMINNYAQQLGGNFDERQAEQLGLKGTVLEGLVTNKLILEAAVQSGLSVSDEEVASAIRDIPVFQRDGHFDFPTYKSFLASRGFTPESFEKNVRQDLLRDKMLAQVRQSAKASDAEAKEEFVKENDRAALTVVRFSPAHFAAEVPVSPAEARAFLATDEGKAEVEQAYKVEAARFKTPKYVKAQHILVKVAEDAPDAEVKAAEQKLADARKRIEGGEDFGKVAEEISEDLGSKDKGGDVGFFGPGTMAKPFEDSAMALEAGQISEPVRTRFGYHLIKVNEVRPATEKPLADVQDQLAAEILQARKALGIAKEKAAKAVAAVKAGKSLESLFPAPEFNDDGHEGHAHGPTRAPVPVAENTGLFDVNTAYVPKVGASAELSQAAAAGNQGDVIGPIESNGNEIVAVITERTRPDLDAFATQVDEYKERVMRRKESALLESFTKGLKEKAKIERNPAIFASSVGG